MSQPGQPALRVLSIEDDVQFAELVLATLRADGLECSFLRVETQAELLDAIARGEYDLVLADYSLPSFDGMSALLICQRRLPEVPFIFLSGSLGEEVAIDSMKLGATDYVLKQRLFRLVPAVRRALLEAEEKRELRRAEVKLREQARMLDLAQDAIIVRDLRDRVIFWNRGAERVYGWTAQEAQGCPTPELMDRSTLSVEQAMVKLLEHGEWTGELRQVTKDSKQVITNTRWTLVRNESGQPYAILAIATDITERQSLEAQLRQSQKMESIGLLAGGIAHDFNNVLTVIHCHSSLLVEEQGLPPLALESAREIMGSAERAANLTRQLLMFSRKQVLQQRTIDLNQVVKDMCRMLQRLIGEDISLEASYCPETAPVFADSGMMEQVLLNMAVNSRDAMPSGGSFVIRTERIVLANTQAASWPEARPGSFVRLTLADSGAGISPENLERIFEPFFTTKEPGKGTGLGLATVFGIIQQHNGWVTVRSELGKGTEFQIYLPLAPASAPPHHPSSGDSVQGGSETILLVEDESSVRSLVSKLLRKQGYRVLEAGTGMEALEVWETHGPGIDLLLTDLVLPGGWTGPELSDRFTRKDPELVSIYLSGYSSDVVGRYLGSRTGVPFVQKPFQPTHLLQTIRQALSQPTRASQPGSAT